VHPDTRFFDRVGIQPRLGVGYPKSGVKLRMSGSSLSDDWSEALRVLRKREMT
jgi:hypothetical protein